MFERIRLHGVLVVLFVASHVWAARSGTWEAVQALAPMAIVVGLSAVLARAVFGRQRSFGWNVAWVTATTGLAVRAVGGALGGFRGHAVTAAATPHDEFGPALVVAGTALLVAGFWLMIRERLEITFASDFLAEGLIIGLVLAYLFSVSGLSLGADGEIRTLGLVNLLPLAFSVTALWLVERLRRLTSESPVAYRWLALAVAVLTAAAACNAVAIQSDGLLRVLAATESVGLFLWVAASLDQSLARAFDPVPVPDRAAVAHVPLMLVIGALGPILAAYTIVEWADGVGTNALFLLTGSLVLPALTAGQLIRRVQVEYSSAARDHRDSLTGLVDSGYFHQAVAEALDQAGRIPGVLYLDLDRFKAINDSLGHQVGDDLLVAVAKRLSRALPPGGLAGRLGGDEFAVLLPDVRQPREAIELADRIIEAFADRHRIAGRDLFVGTSIGIALGTRGQEAKTLIKNADVAMYRAKRRRDRKIVLYSSMLDTQARLRLSLESELRAAVDKNAFVLYYQPKVDAITHRVIGYEALLRWRHPKLGILSPEAFLPIAEETGLVRSIGDWVLLEACRVLRAWQSGGRRAMPIAVNISPRQIAGTDLYTLVSHALERTGADPCFLEVELTETTLLEDLEGVASSVDRLRSLGVKVALDDFGKGYSALSYLQQIHFDWIKLDRTFVTTVEEQGKPQPVISAVLAMAEQLGTPVVAEGVETPGQARWLAERGAQVLQGYLFGRPEPLAIHDTLAEARPAKATNSTLLLAVGLDIHRMRRILADIAIDATPDATQRELLLLADALETGGGGGKFRRRGSTRPMPPETTRQRPSVPVPVSHPVVRHVAGAAPLTRGQLAKGPRAVKNPTPLDAGPLDLSGRTLREVPAPPPPRALDPDDGAPDAAPLPRSAPIPGVRHLDPPQRSEGGGPLAG